MAEERSTVLEFPCAFPLKIMGRDADDFDALVLEIVRRHAPDLAQDAVQRRASRQGKYVSITVTVMAQSQQQLDELYRELTGHARVLMVL